MVSMLVTFLSTCATVAAVLIGGAGVVFLAGVIFYLSYKFARHWLNKLFQDLVDIHGISKVKRAVMRMQDDA